MKRRGVAGIATLLATAAAAAAFAAPAQGVHQTTVGLTTGNQLANFAVGQPQAATLDTITFPAGATDTDLVGIDYRPRGNLLYGYAAGGTLYALRPGTTAGTVTATQVNTTPLVDPIAGTAFGFDFNPVPDAIRVVSNTDENLRVSPDNGNVLGTDTALTPASDVVASAYTNSFQGATVSTLFGIDAATDSLVRQGGTDGNPSPNGGALTTIGPLGVNTTLNAGFDIESSFGADTPADTAYVSLTPAATPTASSLYTVNLATGATTVQGAGPIAGGAAIESIALPLTTSARYADPATQVGEENGPATVTVTRSGPGMTRAASIAYATSDGSAKKDDYTAASGTLDFPANVASRSFTVPIKADKVKEKNETIKLTLSNPSPSLLLPTTNAEGTIRIADNDVPKKAKKCKKGKGKKAAKGKKCKKKGKKK